MAQRLILKQKLLQKLSPQQIQLMKLLQLPTVAMEQRIKEELESNPALDEGSEHSEDLYDDEDVYDQDGEDKEFDFDEYIDDETPQYKQFQNNGSPEDDPTFTSLKVVASFHEDLIRQIGLKNLNDRSYQMATHLIGSLDDAGYLRRELLAITDDLAFTQNIVVEESDLEELLLMIQTLDPAGVGARSLQECLLLQLKRKEQNEEVVFAIDVLEQNFEEFTKKHYKKILAKHKRTEQELKAAIEEILKLNPKPGSTTADSTAAAAIIPDFILNTVNGEIDVMLNSRNAPELRVSNTYSEMMRGYASAKEKPSKSEKDAIMFVKQKLDAAKWFIDAIKQRQHTLIETMLAIVEFQQSYFLEGDETLLKPMILKDIAEKIELDISTISRVVNSKYVQTPYGTFLLKTFFSESLTTDSGDEVSSREVKTILGRFIENEEKRKPLTDEKLSQLLKEKGYNIARRTVAKYREQLNIPVARLRKQL